MEAKKGKRRHRSPEAGPRRGLWVHTTIPGRALQLSASVLNHRIDTTSTSRWDLLLVNSIRKTPVDAEAKVQYRRFHCKKKQTWGPSRLIELCSLLPSQTECEEGGARGLRPEATRCLCGFNQLIFSLLVAARIKNWQQKCLKILTCLCKQWPRLSRTSPSFYPKIRLPSCHKTASSSRFHSRSHSLEVDCQYKSGECDSRASVICHRPPNYQMLLHNYCVIPEKIAFGHSETVARCLCLLHSTPPPLKYKPLCIFLLLCCVTIENNQ